MQRVLEVLDIPIYMSLGCSVQEQSQPQKVLVSLKFCCENYTTAEASDNIKDAICYVSTSELVEKICTDKSYHLIEHAGHQIFTILKERYPSCKVQVRFHKVQPPHRLLQGGTVYTVGDHFA
jgi:dihydroneopterin aldolase